MEDRGWREIVPFAIRHPPSSPSLISILVFAQLRADFPSPLGYNPPPMKYFYGEFNGEEFPTQDKLFGFDQMMQFIMQHGEQALKALEQMMQDPKKPEHSQLLEQLIQDGLLDKDGKGKLRLTPKAIGRMQRRALMEVFSNLRQGQREGHEKVTPGQGGERIEGTKPYQYGDPVSELDIHQTLRNALQRNGLPARNSDEATKPLSDEGKDENASSPSSLPTAIKFS